MQISLGGWFYEQPGIITGMTLSVPQESPWEIAIPSKENTAVGSSLTSKGIIKSDVSITAPSDIPNPSRPKKKKYKALPPLVGEATIDSNVFDQSTLEDQGWRMNQDDLSGDFN